LFLFTHDTKRKEKKEVLQTPKSNESFTLNFEGHNSQKQGVCHTMALPFTLKSILRQKKNYRNLNISPCKNIVFKKHPLKESKAERRPVTGSRATSVSEDPRTTTKLITE